MKNQNQPEPNRFIRLYCSDFRGEYSCVGKWVPYKKQSQAYRPGKSGGRFMSINEYGQWNAEINTWKECDRWEYVDDEAKKN